MPYNGLSANAKGWLLAKHHFATSSIFQQHVKGSAPASRSSSLPLSLPHSQLLPSSHSLSHSLDEARRIKI